MKVLWGIPQTPYVHYIYKCLYYSMMNVNKGALYGVSCYIITLKATRCKICGLWFSDCFLCVGKHISSSNFPSAKQRRHIHKHTPGDMVLINKIIFSLIMHGERHVVSGWIPIRTAFCVLDTRVRDKFVFTCKFRFMCVTSHGEILGWLITMWLLWVRLVYVRIYIRCLRDACCAQ